MGCCCEKEEIKCLYCEKYIEEVHIDAELNIFCCEFCKCMYKLHKGRNLIYDKML